jgi:hypothetical protein
MPFELYLKAFLRLQKVRISKLRGIGHDFIKLGVCSQHKGLVIDSKTNDILEFLTESFAWGRARYLEVGMLAVPDIQETCPRLSAAPQIGWRFSRCQTAGSQVKQQESANLNNFLAPTIDRKAIWNRIPVGGRFEVDRT